MRNEYPVISDLAIHKFLAERTTHLCDAAFSKLIIITSKPGCFLKTVDNFFPAALIAGQLYESRK